MILTIYYFELQILINDVDGDNYVSLIRALHDNSGIASDRPGPPPSDQQRTTLRYSNFGGELSRSALIGALKRH